MELEPTFQTVENDFYGVRHAEPETTLAFRHTHN